MKVVNKKRTMEDLDRGDCFKWNDELYIKVDFSATVEGKNEFTAIHLATGEATLIYDDEGVDPVNAIVTY